MLKKWLLVAWLWAVAAPGWAQAVAGAAQARIATVTEGRPANRFNVPQVQLGDAAVAARINRRLVALVLGGETNPALSVRQQLRQAERTCCYDGENGLGWNTAGQGLTGCDYTVLLNQQGLLSIEYSQEFTGAYTWEQARHATFDLRTGRQLALADLVADPPAQLTRRMHGAISRRLGETMAELRDAGDSTDFEIVAENFHWDETAKRVRFQSDPGPAEEARASEPDLESFALTPTELRLYYERMLPHVLLNLEADNTYRFPYSRVQPRGALLPVAARARPPKAK
ncbi:hypothetical protein JAO73_10150 [Hymenobacter sp. BT523]|uniref:hypothetical protein n=1 Tax=Hymenobacter sp. BT523 TaxID=2795725 RepID=UPI0018ECC88A|nr:hypothetical protein [Hymenobacter sp. BT523]MBJ6109376.1 hypothetical protein [Hymenobacter sp. BT523]